MTGKSVARFVAQTHALATRFGKRRPLRAGSLLVTLLGDAIAPRGGMIALTSLIELAAPFGLPERLVRTSVGRLANDDWVAAQRSGRSSYYSLTPAGKVRFAEATQRIYAAPPDSWNGQWTLIVIPPSLKKKREHLREELNWLGFGELTPGVFGHPAHNEDAIRARLAEIEPGGRLIVIQRAMVTQTSDAQLAALGWDFDELARRYRRFIKTFAPANDALPASGAPESDGETAFILRTLLLHEYRKIHLRDPLLPASLLPDEWVGIEAHALCRTLYAKVFAASERYLSATVQTLNGPLPAPAAEIFKRFGGLPGS
jgi:phenylacetic acid degradation operon negative regulatory protein